MSKINKIQGKSDKLRANIQAAFGNIRQASIRTGISRSSWYNWIERGEIPEASLDLITYRTSKRKTNILSEGLNQ